MSEQYEYQDDWMPETKSWHGCHENWKVFVSQLERDGRIMEIEFCEKTQTRDFLVKSPEGFFNILRILGDEAHTFGWAFVEGVEFLRICQFWSRAKSSTSFKLLLKTP